MKIAGLTWWRNNYGSMLQAYALQHTLNQIPGVEYEILNQYGKKIFSVDNFMNKIKNVGIKVTMQRVFWKIGFREMRKRSYKNQNFVDTKLKVSAEQYRESNIDKANMIYDGFICGSDQIWNPALTHMDSMYWLSFADKGKFKMAYAPSIGVKTVDLEQAGMIENNLKDFEFISCREKSGTDLINSIIGERCVTVLDPTLMVDRDVWDEICPPRKYSEPYVFAYILRGTKEQRRIVEAFAKKKNLKIVTIPFLETDYVEWYDFRFGDYKFWDCAPDEFISLIRYADYIFTDSFHSTIFSCLYHKVFFNFNKIGKAQNLRVEELCKMLKVDSRIICREQDIIEVEQKLIDWDDVDRILNNKRYESKTYITKAFEGKENYENGMCKG